MINKKVARIILIGLSFGLVVSLLFATTYALFSNDAYGSNPNAFSTGTLSIEVVSKSEVISLDNALPMKDEDGVQTTPYIFTVRNSGSVDYLFDIKLLSTDDDNNFSSSYIKLQVNDGEVKTLSQLTNSIIMSQVLLKAGESMDVSLRVWLDWDTPNSELGKSFNSEIVTTGNAVYTEPAVTLVKYITDLYNGHENKVTASNNSIDYYYADIYDKDTDDNTSGGLMNDRLGGTEELSSSIGNIRYYGANPNNYIDIGDKDANGNDVSWRIIGLFKNMTLADGTIDTLVKVIRSEPLSSSIKWSSSTNDWHNANIQLYLKNTFYEGLSSSVKEKTVDVYWNLGAHNMSTGLYPDDIYDYERSNSKCSTCTYDTIWSGRVALMYASDYGYASDLSVCAQDLANYQNDIENCRDTNWLYDGITQWLLTQNDDYNYLTWLLNSQGSVMTGQSTTYDISYSYKARPVLFLSSDLLLEIGHAGTESDPYRISAS